MIRYILRPIHSFRRLRDLDDRLECLRASLQDDSQYLAHDRTSSALTHRYLGMLGYGGFRAFDMAHTPIQTLRDDLGLNPYSDDGNGK